MNQNIHELARRLALTARRNILSGNGGNHATLAAGDGLEFRELRDYQPEDDARYLHWPSLLAPSGPKLKVYQEEQDFTDCIALDVSASMTLQDHIWNLAAETAALLAAVATGCGNGGTIVLFAHKLLKSITLSTGNRELRRATETIAQAQATPPQKTNLTQVFHELNNALKRPARLFIISDFLGDKPEIPLRKLARRHDTTLCHVMPTELNEMRGDDCREVKDAETGQRIVADPNSQAKRQSLAVRQTMAMARNANANYLHLALKQTPYQTLMQLGYKKNVAKL